MDIRKSILIFTFVLMLASGQQKKILGLADSQLKFNSDGTKRLDAVLSKGYRDLGNLRKVANNFQISFIILLVY